MGGRKREGWAGVRSREELRWKTVDRALIRLHASPQVFQELRGRCHQLLSPYMFSRTVERREEWRNEEKEIPRLSGGKNLSNFAERLWTLPSSDLAREKPLTSDWWKRALGSIITKAWVPRIWFPVERLLDFFCIELDFSAFYSRGITRPGSWHNVGVRCRRAWLHRKESQYLENSLWIAHCDTTYAWQATPITCNTLSFSPPNTPSSTNSPQIFNLS